jgi:7-carboxy-7-deazaguanine synthase (Cx14CxxC type)
MYQVKEIFYTLQGEGTHAGRAAVFCRFAGCNLWTGREPARASAICQFCDTDFVGTDGPGGGTFTTADDVAAAINSAWTPAVDEQRFVVCTGGEPLLQLDAALIDALHANGFEIAIETNGTQLAPSGIDWICVSPKAGAEFLQRHGDELKLVYPQSGLDPADVVDLEFRHRYLQPMDGPDRDKNTALTVEYCQRDPRWHLSLQTHKYLGIP